MEAKKSKKIVIVIFIIIVLIGAIGSYLYLKKSDEYTFVSPRRGKVVEAIYGLGKVKTHRKYEVKVGVMTNVKKVFVKEGQFVEKNSPLIQFTDSNVFPAPFSGTVTQIDFHEPEVVLPSTKVMTLEDLDDRYVEVSLEQKDVLRVQRGQKAHILFESLRGNQYKGVVDTVFPKSDEFLVHISIEKLPGNILPGMTADVTIDVAHHENALLIPITSLSNGKVLVRHSNGEKEKVSVKIGSIEGEWAQVLEGDIKDDDQILMKQQQ